MKNCEGTAQSKRAALKELMTLLKSLSSKGKFDIGLIDGVFASMSSLLGAKLASGTSLSAIRGLVDKNLSQAISAANNAVRNGTSAGQRATVDRFGRGDVASVLQSLHPNVTATGGFFDPTKPGAGTSYSSNGTIPSQTDLPSVNDSKAGVAVAGVAINSNEVSDYFNGIIPQDSDAFAIALWIGKGQNPMLMLDALAYAKRLHNDVVLPCASYYKNIVYGSPNYPIRLGQITYGIVSNDVVTSELMGGPPSRHLLGQAVNFKINGIESAKVVEDMVSGAITTEFGTVALTAGIHASLPFYAANDQLVRNLHLWSDNGIPDFVGYDFT